MKLQPVVAGSFYPGSQKELANSLRQLDGELAVEALPGNPEALLLPHAGYVYSGAVAALGYKTLLPDVKTVVLVGPSHYVSFKGVSVFSGEAVVTPLGEIEVDQEACEFLMESSGHIAEIPSAFAREHSVEVHFPLIQKYLKNTKVVPLVMGQGREQAVKPLASALLKFRRKKDFTLIVSSDLSHYPDSKTAALADGEFIEALLTGDAEEVHRKDREIMGRGYSEYHCTHCGKEPVEVLMAYARERGLIRPRLLAYRNSGDVTGDKKRVVGYAAVAFLK